MPSLTVTGRRTHRSSARSCACTPWGAAPWPSRGRAVEDDGIDQALEHDRSDRLERDPVVMLDDRGHDLRADEHLARACEVRDPRGDVDRAPEVVAVAEHDGAAVDA